LRQGRNGISSSGFLNETENRVRKNHRHYDSGLGRPAFAALDEPSCQRNGDGPQQQVDQRVTELREHALPCWCWLGDTQFVSPMRRQMPASYFGAEPSLRITPEPFRHDEGIDKRQVLLGRRR